MRDKQKINIGNYEYIMKFGGRKRMVGEMNAAPDVDKFETLVKIVSKSQAKKSAKLAGLVSKKIEQFILASNAGNVGDIFRIDAKNITALAEYDAKIERLIEWADGDKETIKILERLRAEQFSLAMMRTCRSDIVDKALAGAIAETFMPSETYIEPSGEE